MQTILSFFSLLCGTRALSTKSQDPEAWPARTYGHLRGYLRRTPYWQVLYLHLSSSFYILFNTCQGLDIYFRYSCKKTISSMKITMDGKYSPKCVRLLQLSIYTNLFYFNHGPFLLHVIYFLLFKHSLCCSLLWMIEL